VSNDYNKSLFICKHCKSGEAAINLLHIELQQKTPTIFTKSHTRIQQKIDAQNKQSSAPTNGSYVS
jgi:hypothetical protein